MSLGYPGSVAIGTLYLFVVGSAYSISAWNNQLRDQLELSQYEISLVGAAFTFGQYNSIWAGLFYDRFGVRWSAATAAVLLGSGYYLLTFLTRGVSLWILVVCFVWIGIAHAFPAIVGMAANEGLYGSQHRGKILGLLVASYCAGGASFALIYRIWFDHSVNSYFEFLALVMVVVCSSGIFLLHEPMDDAKPQEILQKSLYVDEKTSLIVDKSVSGIYLLQDSRFWNLFVAVLVGVGSAMFVMNNISFIVESNSGNMEVVPTLVSLFSLCNLVGRFTMGFASDIFIETIRRSQFLSGSLVAIAVSQFLFLLTPITLVALPVACTGFAEGCIYSLFPVLTREYFGARSFGTNYGLVSLSNALGFPFLLGPLSTMIYRHNSAPDSEMCMGAYCFGPTFGIAATLCLIAVFFSNRLP